MYFITTKHAAIHHVLTSNSPRSHHPKTIEKRPFSSKPPSKTPQQKK
jgi:hypothetical protein